MYALEIWKNIDRLSLISNLLKLKPLNISISINILASTACVFIDGIS